MADPLEGLDLSNPPVDVSVAVDARDVELVQKTWRRAAGLGAETVGKVLFMQILHLAPEAIGLFPFKDYPSDRLYKVGSPLIEYGAKVVHTLNVAIDMLTDLPALVPVLKTALPGLFPGAQKDHYGIVGQAALNSLAIALADKWTDAVKSAWLKIWTTVVSVMFPEGPFAADEQAADQAKEEIGIAAAADASEADAKKKADEESKKADDKKKAAEAKKKAAAEAKKKAAADAKHQEQESKAKFFQAAEAGDTETLKKLFQKVKPDTVNDEGMNALMIGAEKGHVEIVKAVLATGKVKVNAVRPQGKVSALGFAAKNNHVECAVAITKAGGDYKAKAFGKQLPDLPEDKSLKRWFTWCMRTGEIGKDFETAIKAAADFEKFL